MTILTLDNIKVDTTNSSLSRITEVHTLLQTQNTLEVGTAYLLNGRLGDDLGATNHHHF